MTKLTDFSTYNMQKILKFYSKTLLDTIENGNKNKAQDTILERKKFAFNTNGKKKIIEKIHSHLFSHIEKNRDL